jgi:hypothetical protein
MHIGVVYEVCVLDVHHLIHLLLLVYSGQRYLTAD